LRIPRQGLRYDELPDAEKEQWDLLEWDDDGNVPADVSASDINQWLFNADTVDKALEYLMTEVVPVSRTGLRLS
jgi:type I restriction enzyme R subunit